MTYVLLSVRWLFGAGQSSYFLYLGHLSFISYYDQWVTQICWPWGVKAGTFGRHMEPLYKVFWTQVLPLSEIGLVFLLHQLRMLLHHLYSIQHFRSVSTVSWRCQLRSSQFSVQIKMLWKSFLQPLKTEALVADAEPEESLGPLEPPHASPAFRRNYTMFLTQVWFIYPIKFLMQLVYTIEF